MIIIHQISRVSLSPDAVDAIVFWTKNPTPMLPRLGGVGKISLLFSVYADALRTRDRNRAALEKSGDHSCVSDVVKGDREGTGCLEK